MIDAACPFWSIAGGTTTLAPSCTNAAKFSLCGSELRVPPPAVSMASKTLAPRSSRYTPGFLTSPSTCTIMGAGVGMAISIISTVAWLRPQK